MLHTNNRLHGDDKLNTGVTTELSKIKASLSGTSHCSPCNTLSLPPASPCNKYRRTSQVDQPEGQDESGFLSFSCSNKLKTNEGCMIDLNSKINRILLSSCINKSKDL